MPTEIVIQYLKMNTNRNKLKLQIALQCAPVMKGIKASNIIGIHRNNKILLLQLLEGTDISYTCLYNNEERCIYLLFRQELLDIHLNRPENISFLNQFGYVDLNRAVMLKRLSERFQSYYQNRYEFPHELGVFLEYPLEDVKAFIEYKGKNCLFSGYWKVYHAPLEAKRIFELYDEAKEEAVVAILNGKQLYEIAMNKQYLK